MEDKDWNKLCEMRDNLNNHGVSSFDVDYLEEYTRLLTLSLEGKGNQIYDK